MFEVALAMFKESQVLEMVPLFANTFIFHLRSNSATDQ